MKKWFKIKVMSVSKSLICSKSEQICVNNNNNNNMISDEVIKQILRQLPIENQLRLRCVSKRFNDCVQQLLNEQNSIQLIDHSFDYYFNDYKNISIDLRRIGSELSDENENLVKLLRKCRNLKGMYLKSNTVITNDLIEWMVNYCPHLESLSLVHYRTNYLTINWHKIGQSLASNLISLEIEARLNQQISNKDLANLISKLDSLKQLSIVCPRRRLPHVFSSLGKNLVKLKITYCLGLDLDEMKALISGNGKRLKDLVIHYEPSETLKKQNFVFQMICNNLLDLESFQFNHFSVTEQSLVLLTNLKSLKRFDYNLSSIDFENTRSKAHNVYFDFRVFEYKQMPSLLSLSLLNVELIPYSFIIMKQLLPNIREISIKTDIFCICKPNNLSICTQCYATSFKILSQIKSLRKIHFLSPINDKIVENLLLLQNIDCFELNIKYSNLTKIIGLFIKLSKNRPNHSIRLKLLLPIKSSENNQKLLKLIINSLPKNLKIFTTI